MNLYRYAGEMPIVSPDPSGLEKFEKSGSLTFNWTTMTQDGGGPGTSPTYTKYKSHTETYDFIFTMNAEMDAKSLTLTDFSLGYDNEIVTGFGVGPFVTIDQWVWRRLDAGVTSVTWLSDKELDKKKEELGLSDSKVFSAGYVTVDVALVNTTSWGLGVGLDVPLPTKFPGGIDINVSIYSWPTNSTIRGGYRMKILVSGWCNEDSSSPTIKFEKVESSTYSRPSKYSTPIYKVHISPD